MPINKRELTKEQIMKAIECKTAEELITLAKSEGIEITEAQKPKRKLTLPSYRNVK